MPDAPDSGPSSAPVGFLSLRLEHTPAGVRATVCSNSDVERRCNDRQTQTLDLERVPSWIHEFIREYLARSS
jgi:hypothetical protein